MKDSTISLKHIAAEFLKLASIGEARLAFGRFVSENFRHHNAYFKGDAESLITAMEDSAKESPEKIIDIKRIIHEGDFVAVHSHIRQDEEDKGAAVMHIFRFKDGLIEELWDFGQEVPENIVNENGMF